MSLSPNSKLVQRTIELNYTNKKRSTSVKWIVVNAVFLLIFVYDLSCKCPGYTSLLHYVELVCAGVLAANLLQYAVRLAPSGAPKLPLSPEQQKLLGLSNTDLDSSFVLTERAGLSRSADDDGSADELALWPRRAAAPGRPSQSPPPPYTPRRASQSPPPATDADALTEYLERCAAGGGPAPVYQLAPAYRPETAFPPAAADSGSCTSARADGAAARPALDGARLAQCTLNLRVWLQLTLLAPLARELRAADAALARLALCEPGALLAGRVPAPRLRALLREPALAGLRPYAERAAEPAALRRVAELARGGCLSAYRWADDAELLLALLAAYLDAQLAGARAFSDRYLADAAAPARRLALLRVRARPPHFALAWRGALLPVPPGRDNLLHALLLLLAAAARESPPALGRAHLGPAGLNMLWIIGR
ncbi:transmembrane protein 209-like [Pararge aegeria]|nr:transmembrane protein 209-like [Pararge aegeria]